MHLNFTYSKTAVGHFQVMPKGHNIFHGRLQIRQGRHGFQLGLRDHGAGSWNQDLTAVTIMWHSGWSTSQSQPKIVPTKSSHPSHPMRWPAPWNCTWRRWWQHRWRSLCHRPSFWPHSPATILRSSWSKVASRRRFFVVDLSRWIN